MPTGPSPTSALFETVRDPAAKLQGRRGLLIDALPTAGFRIGVELQGVGAHATVSACGHEAIEIFQCRRAMGEGFDFVMLHLDADGVSESLLHTMNGLQTLGFDGPVLVLLPDAVDQAEVQTQFDTDLCQWLGQDTAEHWLPALVDLCESDQTAGVNEPVGSADALLPDASPLSGLMAATAAPENRLLQRFVEKLPSRLDSVQAALRQSDLLLLETLLQQFKRSADAHGYTPLGHSIRDVEARIREQEKDLQEIESAVAALVDLCEDAAFARDTQPESPDDPPPSVA